MYHNKVISIIVAYDRNGLIGSKGKMPWFIKTDLEYFKSKTIKHSVIMGRKTFESIGKPLVDRENIILSKKLKKLDGCVVFDDLLKAIENAESEEVFIIGGASIYKASLPYIDNLYITKIDHEFDGDTYFPLVDLNEFKLIYNQGTFDTYNINFMHYKR